MCINVQVYKFNMLFKNSITLNRIRYDDKNVQKKKKNAPFRAGFQLNLGVSYIKL